MSDTVFDRAVDAVLEWHRQLHPGNDGRRGDRAGRARLRRCGTLLDAVAEPQTHDLLQRLRKVGLSPGRDDAAILLAAVLADVAPGGGGDNLARALGSGGDDLQVLKPLRFNALLQAMRSKDRTLQITALRRALNLLGDRRFNLRRFVADVLRFNDTTVRRWNYEYWQTPPTLAPATAEGAAQAQSPSNEQE